MALLRQWALGFCPLNTIERSVSDLIDARGSNSVQRTKGVVTSEDAIGMLEPGEHPDRLHRQQFAGAGSAWGWAAPARSPMPRIR